MPTMVAPTRLSRQEGTYGEVLQWLLQKAGYAATVRVSARPFDQLHDGYRRFMVQDRTTFPDVLVINYGFNECRPPVVPWALLQHLHTWDKGMTISARAYRRWITPRIWQATRAFQRVASGWVGQRTWRTPPSRFAAELRALITFARQERMLVLVVDINPPGARPLEFMPGLAQRRARYQRLLSEVVAGFDDDEVRLVPCTAIVDELGLEHALPEGLHFSAEAHRRLAQMLADAVDPWLTRQIDGAQSVSLQ